ncbi:hypothetical protein [Fusobacterium sp. CAG:649]|mgnify:FL=1|uniref:hypothetical protein n=1 Tax=Fusobacterium sp. CAG:649 TaxID=1262900 RepID=UPI00034125AD|nr:hypothetical protein [Fusobacterium sp. CAG:649]CDA08839.1 putative uncharacterized protein [Fusobacterium sp. CAG:649]
MKYGENKIIKISVALTTVLNIFISIIEIRYIEFIYILIFIGFNIYVRGTKTHNEKENITYVEKKEIVKSNKVLFIGTNILIFFYIFKEPYFFLSKYKILILLVSILIGYSSLIFLQKIKIKLSLNFFKEIIKIFLISGIIYYFPIVCTRILFSIFLKVF